MDIPRIFPFLFLLLLFFVFVALMRDVQYDVMRWMLSYARCAEMGVRVRDLKRGGLYVVVMNNTLDWEVD